MIWFRSNQTEPADNAQLEQPQPSNNPGKDQFELLTSHSLSNGLPDAGEWRGKPAMQDLNGDGHVDLVVSIRRYDKFRIADGIHVYTGDGSGNWTAADRGLPDDMGYGGSDCGDFNGDGRPDVFYSGHDLPPRVFLNFLGQDNANEWVGLDSLEDLDGISCSDVALGDYNNDGFTDAAVMGFFPKTGGLYVLENNGGAEFHPKQQLMKRSHYGAIVHFFDVDGDGSLELVAATSKGPQVWRFRDNEWVQDSDGLPNTYGSGEISGIVRGIAARDLDGDGKAELAVACLPNEERDHPPIRLYRQTAEGWKLWGKPLPVTESCFDVTFANLPNSTTGMFLAGQHGVLVVRLHRDGDHHVLGRIADTADVLNVGAGDANGDGVDDVLVLGQRGVRVFAFESELTK